MATVFLFILGAIVGSFLNVVGLRLRSGLTLGGRSFCPTCHKALKWWELVPILSFIFLRGRCSACRTKISWQYPLVEILTGLVFATLYISLRPFSITSYFLLLTTFCLYIVILIYDLRHKIIPDLLVYAAILLSLVYRSLSTGHISDWLSGPAFFVFFASVWALSKGRAMGFGDAKLALSIGLLLGASEGASAMVMAFWIGSVVALTMMALFKEGKGLTMKSEIPFAPFLILGAWVSVIFHLDLFHVLAFQ
ncbi:prepilin peptidase [Candidatus Parcubacteria bacterium]|nr:prepilin peptidase [Candidatus Parcubacteria bacterium]